MQGYISLATGNRFYVELAVNLALSLKYNDPDRPVCLITDSNCFNDAKSIGVFDHVTELAPAPGFFGCLNKLRVSTASPYEESMFVDSDCLLVKNDMERHWQRFSSPGFSAAGDLTQRGKWYGFEIASVLASLELPYLVKLNSGVFYFRQGGESSRFFRTALDYLRDHAPLLAVSHRNKLQIADEPFIGAAMGALNIKPLQYDPGEGSIMVTTVNASNARFDPMNRISSIIKHDDFRLLGRFMPRAHVQHSPSFAHFVRLKPRTTYRAAANALRKHFGLPPFVF
jgi:hypothetical protein